MEIPLKPLAKGLFSLIPGEQRIVDSLFGSRVHPAGARYCYSVWLRHLVKCFESGALRNIPASLAEIGPGTSLAAGFAALVCGAESYIALDAAKVCSPEGMLADFDDICNLFRLREPIPDNNEFPDLKPVLKDYAFPRHIISDQQLELALRPERIQKLRGAIERLVLADKTESVIRYIAPWEKSSVIGEGSIDMLFSQAVLEHVENPAYTYSEFSRWIKKGGVMSHQIDFRSHGTSKYWNGHWCYPDWLWIIIKGGRKNFINRLPHGVHAELIEKSGFQIMEDLLVEQTESGAPCRGKAIAEKDFRISGAFIAAIRI